jgi:hypothetical protein
MTLMIITLFLVGATTYLWVTRGFMSALIHMVCVIAAGAIAFGVWEPLSMLLLKASPDRGFASFLGGIAWGLGLAVPFAISLTVLRVAADLLLPANAQCDTVVDYVGGGICGLVSGTISAGIIVLSIGFLRTDTEFWGYAPVSYTTQANSRGSLERPASTMVPWVDRITVGLYSYLSLTTLRTYQPMAVWHPDFDTFPGALRMTYDGKSRNTLKPQDFRVLEWYNVGNPQTAGSLDGLTIDHWNDRPQKVIDLDGNPVTSGYITGLNISFNAGARERGGYISVGNGQLRLVAQREGSDTAVSLHPIAVLTRVADPSRIAYARFRFDSDQMFIASVGGESDAMMAFEFAVPSGYRPIALYVKGVRQPLHDRSPGRHFATPADRDKEVLAGKLEGWKNPQNFPDYVAPETATWQLDPVKVNNSLGFTLQKGSERKLAVSQANRGWWIEEGEDKFSHQDRTRGSYADFKLQINRFATTEDTVMVQVDISPGVRDMAFIRSWEAADRNAPLQLIDTNGRPYQAVGYVYDDGQLATIRYTRGQPIRNASELPSISRNTPDRKLTLLFIVSKGVKIKEFRIGARVVEQYDPESLNTDVTQR